MVLRKKVAIFEGEWGRNSAPREGQKISRYFRSYLYIVEYTCTFCEIPELDKFRHSRSNPRMNLCSFLHICPLGGYVGI